MPAANTYNPWIQYPYYIVSQPQINQTVPAPILMPQTQLQPQSQMQPQFSSIWFSGGETEARQYPVAPNNAVALWSENEPFIYLKTVDQTGKSSMKTYKILEVDGQNSGNNVNGSSANGTGKTESADVKEEIAPQFATVEEMASLVEIVKQLGNTVAAIKSSFDEDRKDLRCEIETIKGDMYGIAGKKKRKVEVEEDA